MKGKRLLVGLGVVVGGIGVAFLGAVTYLVWVVDVMDRAEESRGD